jgi:signal transduction histidine kinase
VQEALTNSLKHAGPARASVRVRYGRDVLEVQVTDDGEAASDERPAAGNGSEPPSAATTPFRPAGSPVGDRQDRRSGHGLIGMRERVALFGGTLETGARPDGGYRVAARLPLDTEGPGPGSH